ncbi:MAG: hypothetical protein AAGA02_01290 [Bacteroidota bacterium]
MYIPFNDMPAEARIWIYQSGRQITDIEQLQMGEVAESFIRQWAAHNQPLKGSYTFIYNYFLVVSVDESYNQASGCSIDASVHFVKALEQQFGIDYFDRTKVAFLKGEEVILESIKDLKTKIAEGAVTDQTITFNNLVKNKGELQTEWKIPAAGSWLKRYFQTVEQH